MLAVIRTGSKQYKVQEKDIIKVEKISGEVGSEVTIDDVLLVGDAEGKDVKVGKPIVEDAKVIAKIKNQGRDKKIDVIKYKNKTRYKRKYGHRQAFTELEILSIS